MNSQTNESPERKIKDNYPTKSILIVLLIFLVILYAIIQPLPV